jgi:Opioid growth factor receptor (OGFr) conserved region
MDSPVTASIRLIAFYRDGACDDAGRTLDQILAWPDDQLETVHDFIQWLFPLPERSGANPAAPVLDENAIRAFRNSAEMRERLRRAFLRMLTFYGLTWTEARVARAADFEKQAENWLWPGNHNHLRITRMLRSLGLLGLEAESVAFFRVLDKIYQDFPERITARTVAFWREAAAPFSSPQRD